MGTPSPKATPPGAPPAESAAAASLADADSLGAQLASGFGHEMRNALGAARYPLAALIPIDASMAGATLEDHASADLRNLRELAERDSLTAADTTQLRQLVDALRERHSMQGDLLRRLHAGLQRGLTITGEILEYVHAGHLTAGQEPLLLGTVVQQIIHELSDRARAEGIVLEARLPADLQACIKEEHAFAILRNLIANACDALRDAPRSGRERRVVVRGLCHLQRVEISVEDTGEGMSQATQERVFQPFFTTKGVQGTGLGLGLSRRLAQLYGGDLHFESTQHQGTTFRVWLPQADISAVRRQSP